MTPLNLAEIILTDKESGIIKKESTNADGVFSFLTKNGNYILQIKRLDVILWKTDITLSKDLDLGQVLVIEKGEVLTEVLIANKKKIFEKKVDRMIFNVENSTSASIGDAIDALKIIPNVRLLNDDITLIGKSNLQIMVDDILIPLSQADMINYLKSIPASDIKSIEIITVPSSKYESSGNSGIINIKLKKAKQNLWNASLNSSFIQKTYATRSVGGSFNYKKNKTSFFNSINFKDGTKLSTDNSIIYYKKETWNQKNPRKINDNIFNGRIGIDYEITKKWTSGVQYVGSTTVSNNFESPLISIINPENKSINYYIFSDAKYVTKPKLNSFNWHNIINLDSIGKKVSVDFDYFVNSNGSKREYLGNEYDANFMAKPNSYFAAINSNNQNIENLSGKVDFEIATKLLNLEFGTKISTSTTNNNTAFYNNETEKPILDLTQTNGFKYKEQIQALYISANKKINSKWESQLGFRLETTQTKGFSENLNQTDKKKYAKLFLTAYLTYTPNENNNFNLSYTRRIVRPNYQQLNPFRIYDSPFVYSEGNPYLQPSYTDNFDFTYSYKKLENNLYVTNVSNDFQQIGIVDSDSNITRYLIDNFLSNQNYGISESYTFDKFKCWNSVLTFNINYFESRSKLKITEERNNGINAFISTNNDFVLNNNETFLLNIMYWYNFPGAFGIYKSTSSSSMSISIKHLFLKKDLQFSIIGNDIFSTQRPTYTSYINNIKQEYRNYYDTRFFSISLLYKFGNKKIDLKQRNFGNEDEKNRAN